MIWFLDDIADRITQVILDNVPGPDRKIRPGERVLVVLPDDLKRLYVLMDQAYEKKERIKKEKSDPCVPTEDGPDHFTRKSRSEFEHSALCTCFWESVRSLPEAGIASLSIAEGWQVVTSSPLPGDQLSDHFARSLQG